jgi:hypothetical protein
MYLPAFDPAAEVVAIVALVGGFLALIFTGIWAQRASARRDCGSGRQEKLPAIVFWITVLPISVGVVLVALSIIVSLVVGCCLATNTMHGGLILHP